MGNGEVGKIPLKEPLSHYAVIRSAVRVLGYLVNQSHCYDLAIASSWQTDPPESPVWSYGFDSIVGV